MSTNPRFAETRGEVAKELARAGLAPAASAVDAIAIVGAGYLELQGGSLSPLFPAISASRAATSLVLLYRQGLEPTPPGKLAHAGRFREIVDRALAERDITWPDPEARTALAALALAAWDETDHLGKAKPIGEYFVTLFSNGMD